MNPTDVKNIVDNLLKTGEFLASKAFYLAYRKAIFFGISDIVFALLLLILPCIYFIAIRYLKNKIRKHGYQGEDLFSDDYIAFTIFGGVFLLIIPIICSIISISCGLNWLVNPELGAIRILMDFIK